MRPAFDALFAIDDAMGDVVAQSTQPALGAIKLAWWRERLEELDAGNVPAEPRLQAAAAELLPRGISGAALCGLEDGWAALLDERIDVERVSDRGARLFAIGAMLLRSGDARVRDAGRLVALTDAAERGFPQALDSANMQIEWLSGYRFERRVRPLSALAALAARDLRRFPEREVEGTPSRAWTLMRSRLTGRI